MTGPIAQSASRSALGMDPRPLVSRGHDRQRLAPLRQPLATKTNTLVYGPAANRSRFMRIGIPLNLSMFVAFVSPDASRLFLVAHSPRSKD